MSPDENGYFRVPKKLESTDEVIARICAGLELYYQQKESGTLPKDERTPEQIQDAQDDYWIEKLTRKYESKLRQELQNWRNINIVKL